MRLTLTNGSLDRRPPPSSWPGSTRPSAPGRRSADDPVKSGHNGERRASPVGITLLLLPLLLVAGCSSPDPMLKEGTWSLPPAGLDANNENLRSMLVNPNDLVAGTGAETSNANLSAAPVQRLYTGRRNPLPATVGSVINAPAAQQPASQGAGQGAGSQ